MIIEPTAGMMWPMIYFILEIIFFIYLSLIGNDIIF